MNANSINKNLDRKRAKTIEFSARQEEIIRLVKENGPITSETLAAKLGLTRSAIRADLSILTMIGMLEARPKVGYIYSKGNSVGFSSDYIRSIKVKDVMSKPIVVAEETTVYNAILDLFLNDVGTLFITNNDNLVGAVSRKDFIKTAMGTSDIHKVPIGIIMTRMPNIILIEEEDSAYDAAKKIIEHEVDCLPVVKKEIENGREVFKIRGKFQKLV